MMAITIEFLSLPNVVKMVGSKTITMDYSDQTVESLVRQVTEKYGKDVKKFLLDETGRLDMIFKVIRNKEEWIQSDQMQRLLQDGDRITIMMLVAGG
jgi:molybdopterin converting factor small subunit